MRTGRQEHAVCRPGHPCAGGFAYLYLLIAVAVVGSVAAHAVQLGAASARREAERSLLAIGAEFEAALVSYARSGAASVPGAGPFAVTRLAGGGPRQLQDLVKDPRAPGVRRHLRQVYADPLTGSTEWGIERDAAGGITAIYSQAPGRPIARAGFADPWKHFEDADSYAQWRFGLLLAGTRPPAPR